MITIWNDGVLLRKKRSSSGVEKEDVIQACIVDDHCDIVPFLHAIYRHRKIADTHPVFMLHIDAHPDLSIPSARDYSSGFDDWAKKSELYDLLSEDGGISEFLLPLMQQQHLAQLIWLRAAASQQLPDGRKVFHLQERKRTTPGRPKVTVDWPTSYYIDEDTFAIIPAKSASASVPMDLVTCTAEHQLELDPSTARFTVQPEGSKDQPDSSVTTSTSISNSYFNAASWILDICLDYFFVQNPFVNLLRDLLLAEKEAPPVATEHCLAAIVDVISFLPYRHLIHTGDEKTLYASKEMCWKVLLGYLQMPLDGEEALRTLFSESKLDPAQLETFLQIIPKLSSSTREFIAEKKTLFLLPHEDHMDDSALQLRIAAVKSFIRNFIGLMNTAFQAPCPLCITIARSMSDGYTPENVVKDIEEKVLAMVRELLSELGCAKEVLLHDIAEDAEERCCTLFLSQQVIDHYITTSLS